MPHLPPTFTFRPITRADFPLLATWLTRPHVAEWWHRDPDAVEADFGPVVDAQDPAEVFIVGDGAQPIGLPLMFGPSAQEPREVNSRGFTPLPSRSRGLGECAGGAPTHSQRYRFGDNPDWLAAFHMLDVTPDVMGIDYFLADSGSTGRGVGTAMIRAFVAETFARYPQVPAIVVDVDQGNVASWRALEKAGFARVWGGRLESGEDDREVGEVWVLRCGRVVG